MSGSTSNMPVNVSRIDKFYYCFILHMHVRGAFKASRGRTRFNNSLLPNFLTDINRSVILDGPDVSFQSKVEIALC